MKTILVISTGASIRALKNSYKSELYTLRYKSIARALKDGPSEFIDEIAAEVTSGKLPIDGVLGLTDTASLLATVLATKLGLPHPSLEGILACQTKYLFRERINKVLDSGSSKYALLTRKDLARFEKNNLEIGKYLSRHNLSYPLIIKPVKGALSQSVHKIQDEKKFVSLLDQLKKERLPHRFYEKILDAAGVDASDVYLHEYVLEEYFEGDVQITVDGFVEENEIHLFGATTSEFIPETMSFSRFVFPHQFRNNQEKRVREVCTKALRAAGLTRSLFNAEIVINPENNTLKIIEINPRPSAQFLYLIESVTGYSPMTAGLALAAGETPHVATKDTGYAVAVCFILRKTKDMLIERIPTKEEVRVLRERYSGMRYTSFVKAGKKLSSFPQDTDTFRYAQVKIPAKSLEEAESLYQEIFPQLHFEFKEL